MYRKKLLLMIITGLLVLTTFGCSMTFENFDAYIDAGAPNSTSTVTQSFNQAIESNVIKHLTATSTAFENFGIELDNHMKFSEFVNSLSTGMTDLAKIPLISGDDLTAEGKTFFRSYFSKYNVRYDILKAISTSIALNIYSAIDNQVNPDKYLNFYDKQSNYYSSGLSQQQIHSDVNNSLTLFTLSIDSVELIFDEVKNKNSLNTISSNGSTLNETEYTESYNFTDLADKLFLKTKGVKLDMSNIIDSNMKGSKNVYMLLANYDGLNVSDSTFVDNIGTFRYEVSNGKKPDKIPNDVETHFVNVITDWLSTEHAYYMMYFLGKENCISLTGITGLTAGSNYINDMHINKDANAILGLNSDNTNTKITADMQIGYISALGIAIPICSNTEEPLISGYNFCISDYIEGTPIFDNTNKLIAIDYSLSPSITDKMFYKDGSASTVPINVRITFSYANIKGMDRAEFKLMDLVSLSGSKMFQVSEDAGSADTRCNIVKNYSKYLDTTEEFSMAYKWSELLYRGTGSKTDMTLQDIYNKIKDLNSVTLFRLRDTFDTSITDIKTLSMTYNASQHIPILYENKEVTLNILKNIKTTGDNLMSVSEVPIYIGPQLIGYFYLETLNKDLCETVIVEDIASGTSNTNAVNKYQYFTYNDSAGKQKVGLLLNFYDVGIISGFTAKETITNSNEYMYTPALIPSTIMYNIQNRELYQYGEDITKTAKYDNTAGVIIYSGTGTENRIGDLVVTEHYPISNEWSSKFYGTYDLAYKNSTDTVASATVYNSYKSPIALRIYMEGLYLPDQYKNEKFVCLGRRLMFADTIFNGEPIKGTDPVFCVLYPTHKTQWVEGTTHTINELINSTLVTKTVADKGTYTGIGKLYQKNQSDYFAEYNSGLSSITNLSVFHSGVITVGEFKTQHNFKLNTTDNAHFAEQESSIEGKHGTLAPRLFVWCTSSNIDTKLANYLNSDDFSSWKTWLAENGYENYLQDTNKDDIVTSLITRIEQVYNLAYGSLSEGSELIIDTDGLDRLDDWVKDKQNVGQFTWLYITLRTIGIILLVYGIALLVCYVIDVAVAGEGNGFLYKLSFKRLRAVTGLSREERKGLTETHGTYTTNAISIAELAIIVITLWGIALLLILGMSFGLTNKLIEMAKQITEVFRSVTEG